MGNRRRAVARSVSIDSVMASSERSASSIPTVAGHAEHVYSVAEGATPPPWMEGVSSSWQRSANKYAVDPVDTRAPSILTPGELKHHREPLDDLIFSAQEEIDQLYKVVREARYTVLFCDSSGVAVEHRGDDAQASRFEYWGTWLGGVWSEEVEGTNGIGTCIVEERPVTVHRSQHFRSRHIDLSCSGAPVFGADGRLIAVLDVSAIDPELSEGAHALTGALTVRSARAIEERFFREQFRQEWIVAVAPPEGGVTGMLLAIDGNQRIVGANRAARTSLLLDDRGLRAGVSLWTIFERDLDLFRRKDRTDISTRLLVAGSHDSRPALVTPPDHTLGASSNPMNLHTRPRLDSMQTLLKPRQHRKHTADCRPARCVGYGNTWKCIWAKASICQCWLESPDSRCIILRDNLSNPSVSPRTTTSRKSESNAPRRCWLRRISRYRKLLMLQAFPTKAI